jgi:hypothetical protein
MSRTDAQNGLDFHFKNKATHFEEVWYVIYINYAQII